MQKKIFRGTVALTLITALVVGLLSVAVSYRKAQDQLMSQLWQELEVLSALAEEPQEQAMLEKLGARVLNRLTWIGADGTVLFDNQSNAAAMQNHLEREEIAQAAQNGTGYAKRFSDTLLEEQIYCARRLPNGGFLRISATQRSLIGSLWQMVWVLLGGILLMTALSAALTRRWTGALIRPINEIDLEHPLSNRVYDELSPMLRRMEEQNRRLETQVREITTRRSELETIITHMNEGLLILDDHRHVLLMNDSAHSILHTQREVDGATLLPVYNRSQTLLDTVESAQQNGGAQAEMVVGAREYLLTVSAVGKGEGLVLLMQDMTERNASEKARKRFTANVSHELRTPLTTISGYAELMQSGMTQPSDIPVFSRKIYNESRRLLQLIEDILHLSKLDEGFTSGRMQEMDLYGAARSAVDEMQTAAAEQNVTLALKGESAMIEADPTLLDEMLRNVIENGVKYNRSGGEVQVVVSRDETHACVSVSDTGIGIPKADLDKVFERFYRVDGSRSKRTGGTGLGLSIVKHGAQYHHAQLELESEMGVGTTLTMRFPLKTA